jgi:type IV secretion system protein VirB10
MSVDQPSPDPKGAADDAANATAALEGEAGIPSIMQAKSSNVSWKGILAVALLVLSLVAVSGVSLNRMLSRHQKDVDAGQVGERPIAAVAEPRKLDMGSPSLQANEPAASRVVPLIPAIVPNAADELAEPIGVRRTAQSPPLSTANGHIAPEDAPVLLLSSQSTSSPLSIRGGAKPVPSMGQPNESLDSDDPLEVTKRNLEAYQGQLEGLLDTLNRSTEAVTQQPAPASAFGLTSNGRPAGGLFGGQLQGSATPRVAASTLVNRSLTLPKGASFTCALTTKIISATSGLVGCQVQRNVYGDDGRVLLVERGSHLDGEYRIASVRPGMVRIPVLWTRIRTPSGVTVDIDSPGTGSLGESGIDGYVDNRWGERIGAAMLLSLIDDSVKLVIQNQANDTQANTVVLPSTTANTSKLAEKVLDSTINIPPLIYQNQGSIVGIYVARDVDFSSVYELKALPR